MGRFMYFRQMSDEDLASVIVYVRSIEPVHNAPGQFVFVKSSNGGEALALPRRINADGPNS